VFENDTKRKTFSTELPARYSRTILRCSPQELLDLGEQLKNSVLEREDSAVNPDIMFFYLCEEMFTNVCIYSIRNLPVTAAPFI
jgi:hypothetical protein